ncbi:cytochrome P460 family protein [Pinirhizobacter sp.]|jgi:hypothetical protein|uniref:cytochrome P460 family protein n=1 Tax=Pinirhizobacter sp. TaxID=2950432 RepID=UPI002F40DD3C
MNKYSLAAALGLCLFFGGNAFAAKPAGTMPAISDAHGNLHVPDDYRTTYQFLGSWSIAADKGAGAKQMHSVYASPGAVAAYKKLGHFPDGTVLVKEVFETATIPMTTGTVSHAETLKGWFVMVKDSKNSHPDSKLWGDGWGWSWFDAGNTTTTTTKEYKSECLACHQPAKATDWTYVQGYPVLKK